MKEPQRLAVAKLREKDVGDYLDLTAHATLIALAVPGTSWRGSRDGLLKKLEVGSIVGALLGAISGAISSVPGLASTSISTSMGLGSMSSTPTGCC